MHTRITMKGVLETLMKLVSQSKLIRDSLAKLKNRVTVMFLSFSFVSRFVSMKEFVLLQ